MSEVTLPKEGCSLAARMLGVIRLTADLPEVRVEGFLTSCRVLLCCESLLVGTDRGEVNRAICDGCFHCCEAGTSRDLLGGQSTGTLVGFTLTDVQTRAVRILGRCGTVGTDEVITVVVAVHFLGFCQGTLNILDTRRIR